VKSKEWLARLPSNHILEEGVVLVHGGVRDVQQYMVTPALVLQNAAFLREDFPGARVCFFGHSHEQKVYCVDGNEVEEIPGDRHALEEKPVYFVNPGSIDASRKRGARFAECALYDSARRALEFLRVPYDSAATEVKAAAFGYRISPLTDRLYTLRRRTASAARRIGARLQRGAGSGR
jgi:predicted phosphodiesterase